MIAAIDGYVASRYIAGHAAAADMMRVCRCYAADKRRALLLPRYYHCWQAYERQEASASVR